MRRRTVLLLSLLPLAPPAFGQGSNAQTAAMRALGEAEAALRDALQRIEDGRVAASAAPSRLRQALNEVERAMMQLPADSRRGAAWQTAVKEVTEALALTRDEGADPTALRAAAQEALGAIPALKGEDTATGSS